jgi:hypothetical protein
VDHDFDRVTPRVAERLAGRLVVVELTTRPGVTDCVDGLYVHDLRERSGCERSAWLLSEVPCTARRAVGTVRFIRHPARNIGGQHFAGFDEVRFLEIGRP